MPSFKWFNYHKTIVSKDFTDIGLTRDFFNGTKLIFSDSCQSIILQPDAARAHQFIAIWSCNAVIKAAEAARVPKHKTKAQDKNKETSTGVLISERNKIRSQLENTDNLRGKNREAKLRQLNSINSDIQSLITKEEEKEKRKP